MKISDAVRMMAAHLGDQDEIPVATLAAAVPHFLIRVAAICVERRELDVVREFILRAIALGFSGADEIAGFLGVRVDEVLSELLVLQEEFFVSSGGTSDRFKLLEKGIAAISEHGLRRVIEREAACFVNGVSRKIEQGVGELIPRRKLPQKVLVLPAVPARAPRPDELDLGGVKAAMLLAKNALPRALEISRLGRVAKNVSLFGMGHLMVRRGAHSVPIVCVGGAAESDLARILGAHPALQAIKGFIERGERQFRRNLAQLHPSLRRSKPTDAGAIRSAAGALVALADASVNTEAEAEAKSKFLRASDALVTQSHWISDLEWHVLFARAVISAQRKLIVVPPAAIDLFERESLMQLGEAAARGVRIEVVLPVHDIEGIERDDNLLSVLRGVSLVPLPLQADWCGLSCDTEFAVLGITKSFNSTMGGFDVFLGALVKTGTDAEDLLKDFVAQEAKIAVTYKARRNAS